MGSVQANGIASPEHKALRALILYVGAASSPFYTEQMDAEGLGRKLRLTPPGNPRKTPGYCDGISQ